MVTCNIQGQRRLDSIDKLNFSKGSYWELRQFLNLDWDLLLKPHEEDVEKMWCTSKNRVDDGVKRYVPLVKNCSSWKKEKWKQPLSNDIRSEIKKKCELWKQYVMSKNPSTYIDYKKTRNIVRKLTRVKSRAEQNEIANLIKTNPKKFRNFVKSKTKK
jgi:hypothetical protein